VGARPVRHPLPAKVAFTGSTPVGRRIAAACGELLRPVTLELGGKSAAVLLPDVDLDQLASVLVRTCLRNEALLALLIDKPIRAKDSVIEALLAVGLFALLESHRPDYAVVSATVSACKKLGRPGLRGLVNGVLRRFLRERDELLQKIAADPEAQTLHPAWLRERLEQDWPESFAAVLTANNTQAPMWLRVAVDKRLVSAWLAVAEQAGPAFGSAACGSSAGTARAGKDRTNRWRYSTIEPCTSRVSSALPRCSISPSIPPPFRRTTEANSER